MPKKILLADDSITIQKVVELTFSDGDYEVTAVNNGAKAVQKLAEMRPDIILSDIIMPEKNGYEVCEFVKSHPEYRNIPIILLTGTFEPFDPDRAEKAGCDAVVTKPFESQSLIHKVEELIAQASSSGAAAAEPPAADDTWATGPSEQSAWAETPQTPPVEAPTEQWGEPPPSSPFAQAGSDAQDLFGSPEPPPPTVEVPYSAPPAAAPFLREEEPAAAAPAASPWDEQPAYSGETRTFPRMSFDDLEKMAATPEPPAEPQGDLESPFGAPPPAEEFSGETRAFTKMSFDDLQRMATGEPPPPPPAPVDVEPPAPEPPPIVEPPQTEASPWEEEQPAAAAAPTWDEPAAPEPPAWEQPAPPPPSPWDEQPAFSGETRAFTKMSFDDLQ
ncbi:MAG: response regulator, partial [Thermoanaerobaculia bacterium]